MQVYLISVLGGAVIILRVWFMKTLILVNSITAFLCRWILRGPVILTLKEYWMELMLLLEDKVSHAIQFASQMDNHASQISSWCLINVTLCRNIWAAKELAWQAWEPINLLKLLMTPLKIWILEHACLLKLNQCFLVVVHILLPGDFAPVHSACIRETFCKSRYTWSFKFGFKHTFFWQYIKYHVTWIFL